MHKLLPRVILLLLIGLLPVAGCGQPTDENAITITIVADGKTQVMLVSSEATVNDILREAGITPGNLDRVNPPGHNRAQDGMTITVVRVVEETAIIEEMIPFESRTALNDGLPAGETRMLQAGVNGVAEVTYRIVYEDGVEVSRSEVRRVLITPPQDEVIMIGSQSELPTVTVTGTLAYISGGNAWIIRQNSSNRRPLTIDGGVDGRVFVLSEDGKRLLFTCSAGEETAADEQAETEPTPAEEAPAEEEPFNTLWVIFDTGDPKSVPVRLDLANILYADLVPGTENMIVYSTAEPRPSFPGWQANNDLWQAEIGPEGEIVDPQLLLEPWGGGIYGWYGTFFAFSPDGTTLAWAQPDAVGVLVPVVPEPEEGEEEEDEGEDEEEIAATPDAEEAEEKAYPLADAYTRQTLISFAPRNAYDFIWVPGIAWSPDGTLIATTTHGPPLGTEAPEDSPIFNLTILPYTGGYSIDLIERAGMWSTPQFAPVEALGDATLEGPIAYLQAIDSLDSVVSRYQLVVMDRDGSNRRVIFPPEGETGLQPQAFVWSPDGRQIALIYQGNLHLIDVMTGLAQRLTGDGLSSSPRWAP
jgi:hypothetical protein